MVSLKAIVLALALTGCGDTVTNNYYTSDDDTAGEETASGDAPENSCGNSDLTGKYIQERSACKIGSETPFQEDCTGMLTRTNDDDCSDEYSSLGALLPVSYRGREIRTEACPELEMIELLKGMTPEEIFNDCYVPFENPTPEQVYSLDSTWVDIERAVCYTETNQNVYLGRITKNGNPRLCNLTIFEVTTSPFPNDCSKPRTSSWGQQCQDQFPNPDPCDYEGLCPE